jgi:hypothetical protein
MEWLETRSVDKRWEYNACCRLCKQRLSNGGIGTRNFVTWVQKSAGVNARRGRSSEIWVQRLRFVKRHWRIYHSDLFDKRDFGRILD